MSQKIIRGVKFSLPKKNKGCKMIKGYKILDYEKAAKSPCDDITENPQVRVGAAQSRGSFRIHGQKVC